MCFEQNTVSYSNTGLQQKIKSLNPCTVDWSNVPDYLHRDEFLAIAQEVSGAETVHYLHFMNWVQRVLGTFIADYPGEKIGEFIQLAEYGLGSIHSGLLVNDPLHR